MTPDRPWTTEQAAEYLQKSTWTLQRWRRVGIGPLFSKGPGGGPSGEGASVWYDPADVRRWFESRRRSSTCDLGSSK